ncbi:N-acetylmuramoyl-L-alanine amidase [Halalkalibacter nanhaiisediminis]|uniref:N-acetylmuramoyl-L-alanine amidase n=1 Tax=Halalkalibacter nanhaiisediminis TaxID=688079 RepID=A0A562QSZ8_9BACI|nr:N-acetylmuramoyl-L-alanine amidase [Halalkalibacter nanhaiisediminis]TWI59817.1 N-acetylmuramoyl-L-alanine amidase [Halalkalibacter nanhaiisediminis]
MRKSTLVTMILALLFVSFLPNGQNVAEASGPFSDMPAYGGSEIQRLNNDGILIGNPDGTLRPNDRVTRAEAVTLIGRALELNGTQRATKFSDVPSRHYASGYIAEASERGIVAGTTTTTFSPSNHVTRSQMAVFLSRAFNITQTRPDVMYRDVQANTFGAQAINAITTARISAGYPNGTFGPSNGTTRLEFALFLARALYPEFKLAAYQPNQGLLDANATRAVVYNAPEGLNVRSTPDTSRAPIARLQNGDVVQYYATTGNWAVFTFEGQTAYVSLSYLRGPSSGSTSLAGKVIVVDPGHGGKDPGAVANGVREKDVVLSVGLKLKRKLEAAGATVVMTRSTDVFIELSQRAAIANNRNADAFISIHANAAGASSASGSETFWNSTHASSDSKKLAEEIQREMIKALDTRDRGVKQGNFSVIRNSRMPSVLVELGFITNATEAKKLASNSFQEDAADAIFKGVSNFYK